MVKCASLLARAHLHCDHEQIHVKQKIEKKTRVVRFWKSFRSEIPLGNSNFLNLSFSVATETEVLIYITTLLKVFSCMFNESNDLMKERVSILESITLDCWGRVTAMIGNTLYRWAPCTLNRSLAFEIHVHYTNSSVNNFKINLWYI